MIATPGQDPLAGLNVAALGTPSAAPVVAAPNAAASPLPAANPLSGAVAPAATAPAIDTSNLPLAGGGFAEKLRAAADALGIGRPVGTAQQIMRNADKLGVPAGPGGWARSIVGAAQSALTGLGDAAVGSETKGGPLAGVFGTIAARNERIQKQQQLAAQQKQRDIENQRADKAQQIAEDEAHARIAESNANTLHSQALTYHLGEDAMTDSVKRGKEREQAMESADVPAAVVQSHVTEGQMNALLQQGHVNSYEYTAVPVDIKQIGTDANGQPINQYLYDILQVPQNYTPTKAQADLIRTVPGFENYQDGTIMTGAQTNSVLAQAENILVSNQARKKALTDAGLANNQEVSNLEASDFVKDGTWIKYLNAYHGDLLQAAQHILQDPVAAKKYPNLYTDVMKQFATSKDSDGKAEYETMRHDRAEEAEKRFEFFADHGGDIPNVNGLDGVSLTDQMKANLAAMPKDKQTVLSHYDGPTQSALYSAAFGPGDLDFQRIFPVRVYKAGQLDADHAIGIIKQLNPNWSEQQYALLSKAYKDLTYGQNGQQVETYNNLLAHMSNAQDVIEQTFRHDNPRLLNRPINWLEKEGWGTQATELQAALVPVTSEFENLMQNGHALHDDEQKLYNALTDPAATPQQLEALFKIIGATGMVRLNGLNDQYKKIAGRNVPGLVRRDAADAATHLNLDPNSMQTLKSLDIGDTLFNNPDWKPSTPEQSQQQTDAIRQQQDAEAAAIQLKASQAVKDGKVPQGAIGTARGSDGHYYWVNAQHQPIAGIQ